MTAAPVLEVSDLSVQFPSEAGLVSAVRSVSYTVQQGEILGLVGESGSGKSVSSLAVMDLLPRHAKVSGSVRFRGTELLGKPDRELSAIRGKRVSMIFQDPLSALTPVYTVGDQVAEAVEIHQKIGAKAARERAIELLDLVGIPDARRSASAFPHEFSGGMRQRVVIAMAIANGPDLIIADEPTTALDVTVQAQILEVLLTARKITGAAIVLITHDMGVIAGMADRVGVMYAGRLVEMGSIDDVFYRARMPYTLGLLASIPRLDIGRKQPLIPIEGTPPSLVNLAAGCPFAPRCPLSVEKCTSVEPPLAALAKSGEAHSAACHRAAEIEARDLRADDVFQTAVPDSAVDDRPHRNGRQTVLEVRDLGKKYPVRQGFLYRRTTGHIHAVDGISFDIREGETFALVGESGCGKTSAIMEILNLHAPAEGSVGVLGKNVATMTAEERFRVRRDLQIVFQDPLASLDPRLPVGEILSEPLETHGVIRSERSKRVRELLQLVGLSPEHANRFPQAFSGGQKQRISIARALALEPRVLVLDEPVSALDVSIRAGVINLLERLRVEKGLSYLFVAHDLAVVRHIADRVGVMYMGRLVEVGDVGEVFGGTAHPYTQALLSAIPIPDPRRERSRRRILLHGDLPSPADRPSGCRFRTRCPKFATELDETARKKCISESPELVARTGGTDHLTACHYAAPSSVV